MNILPISQNLQINHSIKKNTTFKGSFTKDSLQLLSIRYPKQDMEKIVRYIEDASDDIIVEENCLVPGELYIHQIPLTLFESPEETSFQGFKNSIQQLLLTSIEHTAEEGKMNSSYVQQLKSYFPKDQELNNSIDKKVKECSELNSLVARNEERVQQQERKEEIAFKTAYPILFALGLYGKLRNGKLAQKALQKAAKVIK